MSVAGRAAVLGLALAVVGCVEPTPEDSTEEGETTKARTDSRLVVAVVNHPLEYFAQRIGGDAVEVLFSAPAGADPATWSPGADIVGAYQQADLIFLNGIGYASWVERSSLPASRIVDTSAGLADRLIPIEGSVTHSHGTEGEHSHPSLAPTVWLDPGLASAQAAAIAAALAEAHPAVADEFQRRVGELESDLRSLDERLMLVAEGIADEPVLFSQPVYQYLIRRYGLRARALDWQSDEVPDEVAWRRLDRLLEEYGARWMVWDSEPSAVVTRELLQRGVESLVFELAANRPSEGDFLAQMRVNVARFEAAFSALDSAP